MKKYKFTILLMLLFSSCREDPYSDDFSDADYLYIEADTIRKNIGRIYLNYTDDKEYSLVIHHHETTRDHQLGLIGTLDFDLNSILNSMSDTNSGNETYCVTLELSKQSYELVDKSIVRCFDDLTEDKLLYSLFVELDNMQTIGDSPSSEQQQIKETMNWPLPSQWFR